MPEPSPDQMAEVVENPNRFSAEGRTVRRELHGVLTEILGDGKSVIREPGIRSDGRTTYGNILVYGKDIMGGSRTAKDADFGVLTREIHDGVAGQDYTVETVWGVSSDRVSFRATTQRSHEFDPVGTNYSNESRISGDPTPEDTQKLLDSLHSSKPIQEAPPQSV